MTEPNAKEALSAPGSVCVVAARGRMGAMFMRRGRSAGLGMSSLDRPYVDLSPLDRAALVVVCVPAAAFEDVLDTLCPRMRKDAVLCDVISVKCAPIQQMLRAWPGELVGTHPLFGPDTPESELRVAVTPTPRSSSRSLGLVEGFFQAMGCSTFETDADSHDKAMARIQNMNFITSLAYFAQTADDRSLRDFLTPSFRRRLDAAKKLLTEDAPMFTGLFDANPYSQQAVRQFSRLLSLASAGDIELLLSRAQHWWPEAKR